MAWNMLLHISKLTNEVSISI